MSDYLPLFRPGTTVTFVVTAAVVGGQLVQVGAADRSVAPAAAASVSVVGVAGHDAAIGDKVTVEVNKAVHELTAVGDIVRGTRVEAAAAGAVRTLAAGAAFGIAISSAADGAPVQVIQL
ncbi:capsid cement protein [Marisediminicola sp. LYQ134]|uniref:capsid cement protein n=1 Tax=Marisediminicola sp. LYQ134 TaxID=3391061 RepID=UPI003983352B